MRSRLLWLAAAPVALVATSAMAKVYLGVEQAQALAFPGASFAPAFRPLNDAQVAEIQRLSGVHVLSRDLKAWRVSTGGWFIADQVVGKHEFITFSVAIDRTGAVKDVEILEYRESYGDQVRNSAWRAQFVGKRNGAKLRLDDDIKNISGATLSSRHVTDGVKRLLATHAVVLASDVR